MLAKTEAAGSTSLDPKVLAFTSSLSLDRALLREDLVGSLGHVTMLSRTGIIPREAAKAIRDGLVKLWEEAEAGTLKLPDEEDVHMAVEALLSQRIGEPAGLLHSARSRNDQVALDLHLHVREQAALALTEVAALLEALATRAKAEKELVLPAYTHRQRAQPISLAYLLCGYGSMFARDAQGLGFVLDQVDELPLGVGAIAGTSLPTDREITRGLLRFSRLSMNGLDTVGNRDFALDFTFAATKSLLHASRVATDFIDFSTSEFGFVKLAGDIACGSSMMPQKRNPDVFEIIRGKAGRAVGNLNALIVITKGLPGGYNRDLQEDRQVLLETGPHLQAVLSMLRFALSKVTFDADRCWKALERDYTQATDLAEGLVKTGMPFRKAYKAVGALVRACQEKSIPLSQVTLAMAKEADPAFDEAVLAAADPKGSVALKRNAGGTGPASVDAQIKALEALASSAKAKAAAIPRLSGLFGELRSVSL